MKQGAKSLIVIALWIVGIGLIAPYLAEELSYFGEKSVDPELLATFLSISFICVLSFISFYLSFGKAVPSFVLALFLGIAARPLLLPIVENLTTLAAIVSLGATLILFQGGLETSFKEFRRLFVKIALLAFPGVLLSALIFSFVIQGTGTIFEMQIPITVAVLLGALLASTDPAAIIPLFQGLKFKKSDTKDIVISESALNDVVGALLTLALVAAAFKGAFGSISTGYSTLFNTESGTLLILQIVFGVMSGVGGFLLLKYFSRHKRGHGFEHGADAAFFIFVPVIAFAGALAFGGSGYLAAFIAGLIFRLEEHLKKTEHFYSDVIDGFAKPAIFLLLGALVELPTLLNYAFVGIVVALVFMFIIRPLTVFLMLGIFAFSKKNPLSLQELLFISFVRETGAIPAVLLVTLVALGLPNIEALVPIGMWVILITLAVEPPLTPYIAKRLGVAEPVSA